MQENKEQNESEDTYKAEEISPVEQPTSDDSDDQEEEQLEVSEEEDEEIEGEFIQGKGCLRGCLTPIIIFFGIILILIMAIYARRDSIDDFLLKRIVANTQKQVLMILPEDMGKDEINTIFENVKTALKEKKIDEESLTKAISDYHDAMEKELSTDSKKKEFEKLIEGLNSSILTAGQQP